MIKIIKNSWLKILLFTISIVLAAINFNLLLKPINVVSGGSGGVALVLQNVVNISTSGIIAIVYVITVILAILFLDKKALFSIIYASILYPVATYLTEDITSVITLNYHDVFLICIASGILSGITNGIAYKFGYAPGGLSVIPPIFNKYFKTSISTVNFITNTIVVLSGAYYYGFNMVIYAIVLLYINSFVCNIVILGLSSNKVLFIRSKKNDLIIKLLHDKYLINATILTGEEDNKETLLAVVKNLDYAPIKKEILKIDKNVFFTTNNCYEVGK